MRGTRTVLASGFLALALITGVSARSAADECLAKPNGPTPQGQHWYYRIDHANDGRQCWYLRQKTSRQTERISSDAMAQAIQAPAAPTAKLSPEENAAPAAAPIPWLNMQTLSEPIPAAQRLAPQKPAPQTRSDDAPVIATSNTAPEKMIDAPNAVVSRPPPVADGNATSARRAKEQPRRQQAQARPEPPPPVIAQVDHTFALLMVVFAALAIAGPALHFVERRRRREAVNFRPPPWARVVALNAPTPRIRVMPRQHVANPTAPVPIRPPDQTERLAYALQQLVDRLQTVDGSEPKAIRIRPHERASI
jgi:hypothetical protein